MKRFNNKGYLLVEIIVASVLAMGIAYFLVRLTINFIRTDEDIYRSISWTNDKNIITNTIMEDVNKYTLLKIENIGNVFNFTYYDSVTLTTIEKELKIDKNTRQITYDDYQKTFDKSLVISEPIFELGEKYTIIKISMKSLYSDEDYGIKLFIPYSVEVAGENVIFDLSGEYHLGNNQGASINHEEGTVDTNGNSFINCGLAGYDFKDEITIMTKLKFNDRTGYQYLIGNWEGAGGGIFKHTDNTLVFELYIGGAYRQVQTSSAVEVDIWYTLVGVYDGNNVQFYLNGVEDVPSTSITGNIKVSDAPMVIGGNPDSAVNVSNYSNATYDNVMIFDRALEESEIQNYSNNKIEEIDKNGLILYYEF